MQCMSPQEANKSMARLSGDEDPPTPAIPWPAQPPASWAEFLSLMERFCLHQGWELDYASVDDLSLAIFANQGTVADGQGRLPFEDESLPF